MIADSHCANFTHRCTNTMQIEQFYSDKTPLLLILHKLFQNEFIFIK